VDGVDGARSRRRKRISLRSYRQQRSTQLQESELVHSQKSTAMPADASIRERSGGGHGEELAGISFYTNSVSTSKSFFLSHPPAFTLIFAIASRQ
jgi:hypothetical protein